MVILSYDNPLNHPKLNETKHGLCFDLFRVSSCIVFCFHPCHQQSLLVKSLFQQPENKHVYSSTGKSTAWETITAPERKALAARPADVNVDRRTYRRSAEMAGPAR